MYTTFNTLRACYQAIRKEHPTLSAKQALIRARSSLKPLPFPDVDLAYGDKVQFTHEGFQVHAWIEVDEYGDISHVGEFTNDSDGTYKRPNAGHREYQYIRLECDFAYHYRTLLEMHYGKAQAAELARSYVQRDLARMEAYGDGSDPLYTAWVHVYRKGIRLGSACLGGIDGIDSDYINRDILPDLVHEAISEANANLWELCDS